MKYQAKDGNGTVFSEHETLADAKATERAMSVNPIKGLHVEDGEGKVYLTGPGV